MSPVNHKKNYIRVEHKLHSISKLFISQVILPQVMLWFFFFCVCVWFFFPIYIPRALNTGTCIQQGDLFYSAGLHRNHVLATANTRKIWRSFGKNAGEWTGRVEISKQALKGEHLSSVFSSDGTLISASAAPRCGAEGEEMPHVSLMRHWLG